MAKKKVVEEEAAQETVTVESVRDEIGRLPRKELTTASMETIRQPSGRPGAPKKVETLRNGVTVTTY